MPTKLADTNFYTVTELAHKLNVTTATVRNYIRQGHLKGQKIMKRWLITEQDLKEFMKKWEWVDGCILFTPHRNLIGKGLIMRDKAFDQGEGKGAMFDTIRLLDRCHSMARVSQHLADLEGSDMLKETLELLESDLHITKGIVEEFIKVHYDVEGKEIKKTIDRMLVSGETSWQILNSQALD
jgi:excisionase family DNA binding protein